MSDNELFMSELQKKKSKSKSAIRMRVGQKR